MYPNETGIGRAEGLGLRVGPSGARVSGQELQQWEITALAAAAAAP